MKDLDIIKNTVESHFETNILTKGRSRNLSTPRYYFYYLARKHTKRTCQNLADYLNQNHANVVHGVDKIKTQSKIYEDVNETINQIENKINLRELKFKTTIDEIQYCKKQIKRFELRKKELLEILHNDRK